MQYKQLCYQLNTVTNLQFNPVAVQLQQRKKGSVQRRFEMSTSYCWASARVGLVGGGAGTGVGAGVGTPGGGEKVMPLCHSLLSAAAATSSNFHCNSNMHWHSTVIAPHCHIKMQWDDTAA